MQSQNSNPALSDSPGRAPPFCTELLTGVGKGTGGRGWVACGIQHGDKLGEMRPGLTVEFCPHQIGAPELELCPTSNWKTIRGSKKASVSPLEDAHQFQSWWRTVAASTDSRASLHAVQSWLHHLLDV